MAEECSMSDEERILNLVNNGAFSCIAYSLVWQKA